MPRKYPEMTKDLELKLKEFKRGTKPTVAGLCRTLGFATRKSLYEYMVRDDEVGREILDAWMSILQSHEERLYEKSCTGSIFYLKNMRFGGWSYSDYPTDEDGNNPFKLAIEVIDRACNADTENKQSTE